MNKIDEQIHGVLEEKKAAARSVIQLDLEYITLRAKEDGVSEETKKRIQDYYNNLYSSLNELTDIFKVDATITQSTAFRDRQDTTINREIHEFEIKQLKQPEVVVDGKVPYEVVKPVPQKERVKVNDLLVTKTLRTEEDVDMLLNTLSAKLKQIIKSNKQIEFID